MDFWELNKLEFVYFGKLKFVSPTNILFHSFKLIS